MALTAQVLPSLYALRHKLVNEFEQVTHALNKLCESYEASPMPMWALHADASTDWLRDVLFDIWYRDGQPGNHSRQHVGLVGATEEQLELVAAVNAAKQSFASTIQAIKAQSPKAMRDAKAELESLDFGHRRMRGYATLGRLHVKQTWRRLPVAEERLLRMHFSWYRSGRSIHRLTVKEAEALLMDFHNDDAAHIQIQLRRLSGIPSREPLARVHEQAPIMRANLFFETPTIDLKMKKSMSVSMPVFVPLEQGEPLPDYNVPPLEAPEKRTRTLRRDVKLESEPFLPSLHVYRYRGVS